MRERAAAPGGIGGLFEIPREYFSRQARRVAHTPDLERNAVWMHVGVLMQKPYLAKRPPRRVWAFTRRSENISKHLT